MNLDRLKEAARKFEQREDWRRAIDVYLQAIREAEQTGGEITQDPGLYNRVGDLQLKAGDLMSALRAYEEAVELYTDQGFYNNAIALCGKILRINPHRVAAYLRLAQLHARKNFVGEARRNLSEFLARMTGPQQRAEAFAALEVFAGQFFSNSEIRAMLVDVLRSSPDVAGDPDFMRLAGALEGDGSLDLARSTPHDLGTANGRGAESEHLGRGVAYHNDLIFLDTGAEFFPRASESLVADALSDPRDTTPHGATALDVSVAARESAAFRQDVREGPEVELVPDETAQETSDIITADSAGPRHAATPGEPGWPERPVATPLEPTGVRPLEAALRELESEARWEEALEVAEELIRHEPDSIARHQKRVELAYYSGDRSVLITAYLGLASSLRSKGGDSIHQAALVYRRVLVHDPDNATAQVGLAEVTAATGSPSPGRRVPSADPPSAEPPSRRATESSSCPAEEPPGSEFVDLAALILDDTAPAGHDGRIRVGEKPLDENEDRVFQEALADFKRGVESRLDPTDFQAHYDLGIAFKEMGLVEEAIAQFQKALRAPGGGLRAAEQLGIAFYEQQQYGIAEAVLRRAHTVDGPDDEKIGILYWFGRTLEAQGRAAEALALYEQAVSLDIHFLDVRERARRLAAELGR
ncbi:MAG: tetratricopeptide repeat protein [Gemmatimonadales bacterium]